MAISNIIRRGYGSFGGGVNKLPTRGYGIGTPVTPPVTSNDFYRPAADEYPFTYLAATERTSTYPGVVESASTYPGNHDEQVQ